MTAMPDESHDDEWRDEWNRDEWYELGVADRNHRNEPSWAEWGLKLAAIALALPVVLGVLFFLLILLF